MNAKGLRTSMAVFQFVPKRVSEKALCVCCTYPSSCAISTIATKQNKKPPVMSLKNARLQGKCFVYKINIWQLLLHCTASFYWKSPQKLFFLATKTMISPASPLCIFLIQYKTGWGRAVVLAAVWFSWGAGTKHFHVFTNFFHCRPVEIFLIFKKSLSDR